MFREATGAAGVLLLLAVFAGCVGEAERDAAADLDPATARLLERMHEAYERDDWHRALALADSVEARTPRLAAVPVTRGRIFIKLKRHDEAAGALRLALERNPDHRQAWYHLGHNAFLQRRYREAVGYYERERALVERVGGEARRALPAVTAQVGRTYELLGVRDSAQIAYQRALELDSTYAVAHAWLSELHEHQGRLDVARRHARRALQASPDQTDYMYRLGVLLFQTGRVEEAVPLLREVVQRWPGHEGATYNLGRALKVVGRTEEGEALLARVEEVQQLQERALQAQRAVEMYPDDPRRWIELGGLMLRAGYYDKAEQAFSAALARNPGDLSLRNDLANLALVRGDTTLALQRFEALVEQHPAFADAWLNLGILYVMSGEPERARRAWQQVLRQRPDDADAKAYLARLK